MIIQTMFRQNAIALGYTAKFGRVHTTTLSNLDESKQTPGVFDHDAVEVRGLHAE